MTDNPTGPELFAGASSYLDDITEGEADYVTDGGKHVDNRLLYATIANARAVQAQTAMLAMLVTAVSRDGCEPYEIEAWREVIPRPPLRECKSKEARRPACAERHTVDCDYADPIPEPKHELLPIGTRVLVSERAIKHPDGRIEYDKQPKVAKIVGYDTFHSKYQLNAEKFGGGYYDFVTWAFADNRVQPHPEQDGAIAEPTGPRMYVEDRPGRQGYIMSVRNPLADDVTTEAQVHWFVPGAQPVWVDMATLTVIASEDVARCENGQTGDECAEGENQCELCLAAEDAEAEAIEKSMGV